MAIEKLNFKLDKDEKSKILDLKLVTSAMIRVGVNKAGVNYAMLTVSAESAEIGIPVSPDAIFLKESDFFTLTGKKLN